MNIDLDAARRARQEKLAEPDSFTYAGRSYTLPAELPLEVSIAALENRWSDLLDCLLGPEQAKAFRSASPAPTHQDILELLTQAAPRFAEGLPESLASGSSSPNGGGRSRRTSNGSTGSTSRKRAGGAPASE